MAAAHTFGSNNEALVSFVEGNGTPPVVERTRICPPTARLGVVSTEQRRALIARSPLNEKYGSPNG